MEYDGLGNIANRTDLLQETNDLHDSARGKGIAAHSWGEFC